MHSLLIEGLQRNDAAPSRPASACGHATRVVGAEPARGWTALAAIALLVGLGMVAHWMAGPSVVRQTAASPAVVHTPAPAAHDAGLARTAAR